MPGKGKNRVFSLEFKKSVVERMLNGEGVSSLQHEQQVKRSVLYRWRDAYRREGAEGLARSVGRPAGIPAAPRPGVSPEGMATRRIAELERKIGQQAMDLEFFRKAFKRVKASRRNSTATGGTASMERSET